MMCFSKHHTLCQNYHYFFDADSKKLKPKWSANTNVKGTTPTALRIIMRAKRNKNPVQLTSSDSDILNLTW